MSDAHPPAHQDIRPAIVWGEILFWFFRLLSAFQIVKGLVHWALLLGIGSGGADFADGNVPLRAATIFFAVLDPVAGVGLWMTSSWGAVLWLFAAASQIGICLGFPLVMGRLWLLVVFEVAAIAAYLWLTFKVTQARAAAD